MEAVDRYGLFAGVFLQAPRCGVLEHRRLCVVVDRDSGRIVDVLDASDKDEAAQKYGVQAQFIYEAGGTQAFVPGFIDCHTHAPQYKFAGTGSSLPLLAWLQEHTFPTEKQMVDDSVSVEVYSKFVRRLLMHGTTTAMVFGTLHLRPCKLLARICRAKRLRAFVGKVCMDRNSPEGYKQSLDQNVLASYAFIKDLEDMACPYVKPVVTPRFVPTCSRQLLTQLADLAVQHGCHVTSHMAETRDEVEMVAQLHPNSRRDAVIFAELGMLRKKTVMAHCIHCSDAELKQLADSDTGIAHCPLANCLVNGDGILRARQAMELGCRVGLGTDIAGGHSPSILVALRTAVLLSKLLQNMMKDLHEAHMAEQKELSWDDIVTSEDPKPSNTFAQQLPDNFAKSTNHELNFKDGFYMATMGGARCLGIEDELGTLDAPGKFFDACLIDMQSAAYDTFPGDTLLAMFERFLNLGDDRNILKTFVGGRPCEPDAAVTLDALMPSSRGPE